MNNNYDVIVVGAGHAGCEAASAAARMGSSVLMITMDMGRMGQMSCNPAMGGVAKGQIIREIDALGGMSGIISDKSAIQFRMLNRSKGPAMWSPRTQNDRVLFSHLWREHLEGVKNLDFWQEMVTGIVVENNKVVGVKTSLGTEIKSKKVILTSGTFLNGLIHIGEKNFGGGRAGEKASYGITEQLVDLGFESGRMKTGTPPRIDGRSLNYSRMEEQKGDKNPYKFSFSLETKSLTEQKSCFITYTNPTVHELLEEGFDRSPMFNGRIKSIGPRYCPSIEDKINRFKDRERHQIFVEPEGWNTVEIYVNGFSTSLPLEVQLRALKEIPGFESVKIFRPGYAIEYDYFPPIQLKYSLETKIINGLFFAGQINGTTGYEEAACQGLMAGINASLSCQGREEFVLSRDTAYIGVLIDDLIMKGTEEPYRMFTSRAEFRILLRQDNADQRLSQYGYSIGLLSEKALLRVESKKTALEGLKNSFASTSILPAEMNPILERKKSSLMTQKTKSSQLLARPELSIEDVFEGSALLREKKELIAHEIRDEVIESFSIESKYSGYISKEKDVAEKIQKLDRVKIPSYIDFYKLTALSSEAREKLARNKPETVGQASRISGISPSDVSILLVHMNR